jgi:predicted transcriptional regulator
MAKALVNCGGLFRLTVPAARAAVVRSLKSEGLAQTMIAHMLGIAQPAVSRYLSGRYSNKIKILEKFIIRNGLEKKAVASSLAGKKIGAVHCIDLIASNRKVMGRAASL